MPHTSSSNDPSDQKPDASQFFGPIGAFVVNANGHSTWHGPIDWFSTHGPSKLDWLMGRPIRAFQIHGTEGIEIQSAEFIGYSDSGYWRRLGPNGVWIRGLLMIENNSIQFVDTEALAPQVYDTDDLEAAMMNDAVLKARADADDDFAGHLYASLCNTTWRRIGNDRTYRDNWSCSWRYAGGVVANLRSKGECYLDWYCWGHEGTVFEEVKEELERLGWRPIDADEEIGDHEAAVADMALWRNRDPNLEQAAEFAKSSFTSVNPEAEDGSPPTDPWKLYQWLRATGRINEEESNSLVGRL